MSISSVLYDGYDKAFVDFVGQIRHKDLPIPRVFATPERAFAQMRKILGDSTVKRVSLPFLSISRLSDPFAEDRFIRVKIRKAGLVGCTLDEFQTDGIPTAFVQYQRPKPIDIQYQVDSWADTLKELEHIRQQWSRLFIGNSTYVNVDHGSILGVRSVFLREDSVEYTSDLETSLEQRAMRRTFTATFQGWIPYDSEQTKSILAIDVEKYESDDMETLGEHYEDDRVACELSCEATACQASFES